MPLEGTVKDVRSLFHKRVGKERIAIRYAEGLLAVKEASQKERAVVVNTFMDRRGNLGLEGKGKGKAKAGW
jgi:hypothetical protein